MEEVGKPLSLKESEETAAAILRIANTNMAGALRLMSLARGHDPRDFVLFAFGGAGPLHAAALSRELGIPKVLVPMRPGITNAVGCVAADVRHDFVNSINLPLVQVNMDTVRKTFESQIAEGQAIIKREGIDIEELILVHDVDMQFQGQTHILSFPVEDPGVSKEVLRSAFEEAYWNRFSVELPEILPVLVNLHSAVIGRRKTVPLQSLMPAGKDLKSPSECRSGTRSVWFEEGWRETPIFQREPLQPGSRLEGPAVLEQMDSTVVVDPGDALEVDTFGNLVITLKY